MNLRPLTVLLLPGLLAVTPVLRNAAQESKAATAAVAWRTDYAAALREARTSGRPLVVLFQCPSRGKVPFLDAAFAADGDPELAELLTNRAVPVRLTSLKGVDLNTFRFDYDLTFAALVLDPRTEGVLARYGTRDGDSATARLSVAGFKHTLRAAVARMQKDAAPPPPPARPSRTITSLYPAFAATRRAGEPCYHCHYANDAALAQARAAGSFTKTMLFRYPLPENIGLVLDTDRGGVVKTILPGSPAAKAGVRAGDVIEQARGVPVASTADLQWALDPAPEQGGVALRLLRDGKRRAVTLKLAPGWRRMDISWRPSQGGIPPILGIWEEPLTTEARNALGIAPDRLALKVTFLFDGEKWKAARGGFRRGDVIIAAVGKPPLPDLSPRQFHSWYRLNYDVGQTAVFTVLRDGKRAEVRVACVDVGLE